MSMTPDDLENQDDPKGLREAVERANREKAEAQSALEALQRREAFRDAGLNPADPLHAAVIGGYDGDLTGVKDFVSGLGLDRKPDTPPPVISQDEQDAMARMSGYTAGDGGGLPGDPDAEGNARLKAVVDRGRAEGWGQYKFNEEFRAEMVRQGRPVAQLEYEHIKPS